MAVDYTFQNVVNIEPAAGLPGGYAAVNPIVSTPRGFIAKAAVTAGCFCWEDSSDAGQVNPSGSGMPLGLVVREVNAPMATSVAYTNAVPIGSTVTVAVEGDFWVAPTADVTKGQKVFANTTTGAVKGGSAGATVSDHVETNWVFETSADADAHELAIISNHGQTPAASVVAGSFVSAVVAGSSNYTLKVTKGGTDSTVNIGHA